jgi:hypothetical protein
LVSEGPSKNSLITGRKIMEYTNIGVPQFNEQSYDFWSAKMKSFLGAQGFDVWKSVVTGYTNTKKPRLEPRRN